MTPSFSKSKRATRITEKRYRPASLDSLLDCIRANQSLRQSPLKKIIHSVPPPGRSFASQAPHLHLARCGLEHPAPIGPHSVHRSLETAASHRRSPESPETPSTCTVQGGQVIVDWPSIRAAHWAAPFESTDSPGPERGNPARASPVLIRALQMQIFRSTVAGPPMTDHHAPYGFFLISPTSVRCVPAGG